MREETLVGPGGWFEASLAKQVICMYLVLSRRTLPRSHSSTNDASFCGPMSSTSSQLVVLVLIVLGRESGPLDWNE